MQKASGTRKAARSAAKKDTLELIRTKAPHFSEQARIKMNQEPSLSTFCTLKVWEGRNLVENYHGDLVKYKEDYKAQVSRLSSTLDTWIPYTPEEVIAQRKLGYIL